MDKTSSCQVDSLDDAERDYDVKAAARLRDKQFGSFYTPNAVAASLAIWAIRSGNEKVLEPSAGEGALIKAAIERAKKISTESSLSVTAYDVDPRAVAKLKELNFIRTTIVQEDFLHSAPVADERFDVVIANPPFTRNHALTSEERKALPTRKKVSGAAGLWAHFLIHSSTYLTPGGRLASIVPNAATFTQYGKEVLRELCKDFAKVSIFDLSERPEWSSKADERGAVITADGYKQGPCKEVARLHVENETAWVSSGQPIELDAFKELMRRSIVLSELATVSIGAVTGRNAVFLLSEKERLTHGISREDVRPVLARARQVVGMYIDADDLEKRALEGEKTWLLAPRILSQAVEKYLAIIADSEKSSVVWFAKRSPWWKIDAGEDCDAVFTYMNHQVHESRFVLQVLYARTRSIG